MIGPNQMNAGSVLNFLAACDAIAAGKPVQVWTHADEWVDVDLPTYIDGPLTLRVFLSQYRVKPEGLEVPDTLGGKRREST